MRMFEKYHDKLKRMIRPEMFAEIVPMDITPAAKWFLQESDKEFWDYRNDFPCVLPPAPLTWLEFEYPPFVKSSERMIMNTTTRALGALVFTMEVPEKDRQELLRRDGLVNAFNHILQNNKIREGLASKNEIRKAMIDKHLSEGTQCRWLCFWQLFGEPLNTRDVVPFLVYGFYLDEKGQVLGDLGMGNISLPKGVKPPTGELGFADALPFWFALSLTHCRNVEITESTTPPAVAKKRKERGIPDIKFKQLVIKPIKGKRTPENPSGNKLVVPLHYIRSHFKTFTEDRKLFGKYAGTYFWHMHAKGNSTNGEIVKQYKVKP